MTHPNYDPKQLGETQVELAALLRRGFDHLARGASTPLPAATFTHPQIAATQATVLATAFAAELYTAEGLDEWVQKMEDQGIAAFRTNKEGNQ